MLSPPELSGTKMVKPAVATLSDDEGVSPLQDLQVVPAVPAQPAVAIQKKRKLESSEKKGPTVSDLRGKLGKLTNASCACARASRAVTKQSCFKQFQGGGMDGVFQLVWRLRSLDKQDMDNEACYFSCVFNDKKLRYSPTGSPTILA